jgi:hypothetical protein
MRKRILAGAMAVIMATSPVQFNVRAEEIITEPTTEATIEDVVEPASTEAAFIDSTGSSEENPVEFSSELCKELSFGENSLPDEAEYVSFKEAYYDYDSDTYEYVLKTRNTNKNAYLLKLTVPDDAIYNITADSAAEDKYYEIWEYNIHRI